MNSDKAKALHDDLMVQVNGLRTSQAWLDAMTAAARFHKYSFGNWLLMWAQAEQRGMNVSMPAGYGTWQGMGRQVRRGEKALKVFAPMVKKDDDGDKHVFGFRVVSVFDVSQTDGDALPEMGVPALLEGEGDKLVQEATVAMIESEGFSFTFAELAGPNGVTKPKTKEVVVDSRLAPAQATKTTVHELAHVLMHVKDRGLFDCRGVIEVEAESVAYVVCAAAGLDTSSYSVAYVAGWAEETEDPDKAMLATAERVVRVARKVLARVEGEGVVEEAA